MAVSWLVDQGFVPDRVVRAGIRRLLTQRAIEARAARAEPGGFEKYREDLRKSPLAVATEAANEQHYEVPAGFFELCLGPHLKYSACEWPAEDLPRWPELRDRKALGAAEEAALARVCERAELAEGQRILELGCGWGSLSLFMAALYPKARILGLSNSHSQRAFITERARERGLTNLQIVTCNMTEFEAKTLEGYQDFDRVVSVEMFEHMRNYEVLLERVASWMAPEAKLFVHIFTHCDAPYLFVDRGPSDWMARHFFSGGQMPSADLLPSFDKDLRCTQRWDVDGRHYALTAEAWLANMDANERAITEIFRRVYGRAARVWWRRWRVFFMACAELWGFRQGREWGVTHYLFEKVAARS